MKYRLTIVPLTEKVLKLWADDGVDAFISNVMTYRLRIRFAQKYGALLSPPSHDGPNCKYPNQMFALQDSMIEKVGKWIRIILSMRGEAAGEKLLLGTVATISCPIGCPSAALIGTRIIKKDGDLYTIATELLQV